MLNMATHGSSRMLRAGRHAASFLFSLHCGVLRALDAWGTTVPRSPHTRPLMNKTVALTLFSTLLTAPAFAQDAPPATTMGQSADEQAQMKAEDERQQHTTPMTSNDAADAMQSTPPTAASLLVMGVVCCWRSSSAFICACSSADCPIVVAGGASCANAGAVSSVAKRVNATVLFMRGLVWGDRGTVVPHASSARKTPQCRLNKKEAACRPARSMREDPCVAIFSIALQRPRKLPGAPHQARRPAVSWLN